MKTTMIAALAAAQLTAAASPALASDRPHEEAAAQQNGVEQGVGPSLADAQSPAAAAREDEPRKKKRKSTGDKVLTGAAVVLGVGALAVGGLLIAIFVN